MLRISGVSVDRTQWMPAPAPAAPWRVASVSPGDLRNLMSLMSASGWRLLLGLDLGHLVATALVEEARAATAILGRSLAGVEIGNEPDLYTRSPSAPFRLLLGDAALRPPEWGLSQYENEISGLRAALAFAGVAAPLYGPDTARLAWLESYAEKQGHGLAALAQHIYPLDRCYRGRLLRTGPSLTSLLSRRTARRESRLIAAVMRVARGHGLPLRIFDLAGHCGRSHHYYHRGNNRPHPVLLPILPEFQSPHQRRARNKPVPRFQRKHGGVLTFGLLLQQRRFNSVDHGP